MLVVVTARPTFVASFASHPIVTRLGAEPAGAAPRPRRSSPGSPAASALPEPLLDEIAARTDGVPLFVEEMTKAVLELGALREAADAYHLDGPLSALAIPTSLHDSLMARLDRLQPVKEVAQTAAVIGRSLRPRDCRRVGRPAGGRAGRRDAHAWSRPSWSSAAARRRTPPTCSSTLWSATRPMRACCKRRSASPCMPGWSTCWKARGDAAPRSRRSMPRRRA